MLKFVVSVVVAVKLLKLFTYPPVMTALPVLKFVVCVLVAVKFDRLFTYPPVMTALAVLNPRVDNKFVKTPVLGVVLPIGVLFIAAA